MRSRRRRAFRLLVRLIGLVVLLAVLGPAVFIGATCYSGTATAPAARVPSRAVDLPGYARPMAFTYLTLPEWFIVYSADEYAAFISRQPPSAFPYVGSVRQYWGYYSAACTLTKGVYPFETGYHVMLGTIGASFTLESFVRAAYEGTIGRLTERHGPGEAGRIRRGVEQVAQRWWAEDGDPQAFAAFCEESFLAGPDPAGHAPPSTLAILTAPEPNEFSFASFFGPGGANAPVLNLVLTVSPPMELQ